MWVYPLIGIAIVLLLVGGYHLLNQTAREEAYRDALETNEHLIRKQRKLEAENRRLASQLRVKEYQVNSMWENRYEQLQEKNRVLEREIKVKDALLKAMEGKIEVAG